MGYEVCGHPCPVCDEELAVGVTNMNEAFQEWPKIPRLKRTVIVTEKIDGTNAHILFTDDMRMLVGSRTKYITPGKGTDNFGFAEWCRQNEEELRKLGPGRHYGEWFGAGIQRGYGLSYRQFALFNTSRWKPAENPDFPKCCTVVPVLAISEDHGVIDAALQELRSCGSRMVPGYMNPEGIVVYHTAAQSMFKVLLENDHQPKGQANGQDA